MSTENQIFVMLKFEFCVIDNRSSFTINRNLYVTECQQIVNKKSIENQ